jgi:hypothetical protein
MSRNAFRHDWDCTECGTTQSKHNLWFDGVCETCNTEKLETEKKNSIGNMLLSIFSTIGIDKPNNFDDILEFCYDDVEYSADEINWHSGDVAIAFRRWIEDQASEQP